MQGRPAVSSSRHNEGPGSHSPPPALAATTNRLTTPNDSTRRQSVSAARTGGNSNEESASQNGSDHSHNTVEKAEERHRRHRAEGELGGGEEGENDNDEDSYTSYYDYDSYDDEEDGDEEYEDGDDTNDLNSTSRRGSPSPPPQEELLRFLSFTLEEPALKDHRLMTIEGFRQVLLLGTNQGAVAVVDSATGKIKDLFFNHREPISDVDCTVNELYVASSDKAGYVSIQSRRDKKDVWISQLGMPIDSLAIHPIYHKLDSCPLVCGGGTKVLMLTKGILWSNSRRVTTLQEGRGRVYRVRWCHRSALDVVAWLSDLELTLYDVKSESVVRRIPLPTNLPQNALYPPTLRWERGPTAASSEGGGDDGGHKATLLCGWGDIVQELRVLSSSSRMVDPMALASAANSAALGLLQTAMTAPFQQRTAGAATPSTGASSTAAAAATLPAPPSPSASSSAAGGGASLASSSLAAAVTRSTVVVELRTAELLRPSRTAFPYRVCGIAPYGPHRYVVLASIVDAQAEGVLRDVEVRVVERTTLLDVYRGRMPVRFIHPLQLHLAYLDPPFSQKGPLGASFAQPEQLAAATAAIAAASSSTAAAALLDPLAPSALTQYFILSVDAIVKATPSDMDDHVEFLLRTAQFEKAYRYAAQHSRQLRRHVLQQVGHQWLLHLFERRNVDSGAILRIVELLPELVPQQNSLAWEQWIYRLDTCGESWRLVALLPGCSGASAVYHLDVGTASAGAAGSNTGSGAVRSNAAPASPAPHIPIDSEYYNLVLLRCLRHDPNLFYAALHKFKTLFTVSVVLKATEAAYREHCGSYAWWADDSGEEDDKENEKDKKDTEAAASLKSSEPTSPSSKQPKKESGDDAAPRTLSRTARWSLAAGYGFLLRCAGRYEEAMQTLMHLPSSPRSDRELFGLIRSEQLFHATLQVLPELLQRREEVTLQLLMEHVAPPKAGAAAAAATHSPQHASIFEDELAAATPDASPHPQSLRASLDTAQFGSAADPLNVEAVIGRLESSSRLHLLRYLDLVKEVYPKRFVEAAKRHAQLVATLYIDYDRSSLLPFLKQMSMYVERIRELHALCHKNGFVEEEIFLLFRMGREEEALRILIEKMHNIHRALEFVVSIPDRDEQAALFVRLIDYTVNYNASLPCRRKEYDDDDDDVSDDYDGGHQAHSGDESHRSGYDAAVASGGIRYLLHYTQPGETYASIAQTYHVAEADLLKANSPNSSSAPRWAAASPPPSSSPRSGLSFTDGSGRPRETRGVAVTRAAPPAPPPPRCIVPLNLFGALLTALADPQFSEHSALDVRLVLRKLPKGEPIPHAGRSIAAIAHTMAEENAFLSTVSEVDELDLMGYYAQLLKRRTAAIAVGQCAGSGVAEAGAGKLKSRSPVSHGRPSAVGAGLDAAAGSSTAAHRCAACHQFLVSDVVVFACQHMYHSSCVLQYVAAAEAERGGARRGVSPGFGGGGDISSVLRVDAAAAASGDVAATLQKQSVYCRVCRQQGGENK